MTKRDKPGYLFIAMFVVLAITFQGCLAQKQPENTLPTSGSETATAMQSSGALTVSAIISPVATPGLAETSSETTFQTVTQSPMPTASPCPTPVTTAAPKPVPFSAKGFTVNTYTASDSMKIYYASGNGIHSMNSDGRGDKKLSIKNFYEFIAFNTTGLYYLAYDYEYVPTRQEEEGLQWCNSFNLMLYNTKEQKTETVQKHIFDAIVYNNSIYDRS